MKKTTAAVIVSAIVITLGGTTALAYGQSGRNGSQNDVAGTADMVYNQNSNYAYCEEYGRHCTDADNDGICDYRAHDADNGGVCGGTGQHHAFSVSRGETGHHAGHGYGHR